MHVYGSQLLFTMWIRHKRLDFHIIRVIYLFSVDQSVLTCLQDFIAEDRWNTLHKIPRVKQRTESFGRGAAATYNIQPSDMPS